MKDDDFEGEDCSQEFPPLLPFCFYSTIYPDSDGMLEPISDPASDVASQEYRTPAQTLQARQIDHPEYLPLHLRLPPS